MIAKTQHLASTIASLLLAAIILWGPVLFGSVLPRERLALQVAAFAALAVVLVTRGPGTSDTNDRGVTDEVRAACWAPAAAIAAVAVLGLLQSLSWPASLVSWLAPLVEGSWRQAATVLSTAGDGTPDAADSGAWLPLSLAPAVSRTTALLWLACAAAFAAATHLGEARRLRRFLGLCLMAVVGFEIVYGLNGTFSRLHGTFVNPDHFASFLIIALAANLAWAWWSLRRVLHSELAERRLFYLALPLISFLLVFVGLVLTGSRGGFLAVAAALGAQVMLLTFRSRRWQTGLLGLATVAFGGGGVLYFGWERSMGRWLQTSAFEIAWNVRLEVYAASFELWRRTPWTGSGLGTFRQAFPLVQPATVGRSWHHAHSDVVELLATTGLLGLTLVALGLVALGLRLWRNVRRGRRSEDRATALAACGGVVGLGVHSLVDFGLTLPANAFLLAIVAGLACGVPTFERSRTGRTASPQGRNEPDESELNG